MIEENTILENYLSSISELRSLISYRDHVKLEVILLDLCIEHPEMKDVFKNGVFIPDYTKSNACLILYEGKCPVVSMSVKLDKGITNITFVPMTEFMEDYNVRFAAMRSKYPVPAKPFSIGSHRV